MNETRDVDVLIVGGGINGCGTFRDLCAQGIECLLLERNDFCSGASAGSSRLVHGGLKYLETGEFRLVRESAQERNRLLANAPHYVTPLPCIVPVRSRFGGIVPSILRFLRLKARLSDRGSLITALGLTLYDIYGRNFRAMPTHRMLGRRELGRTVRGLDRGIIAAGLYYEGQLSHAERLGFELVLDGEALNPGSQALNHAEITATAGGVVSYLHQGRTCQVRPRIIVNAGGAWIDRVNGQLGLATRLMGGSKGAHLVVENADLHAALNGHMVYFGTADGRVNLVYPFMNRVLIGSTDIKIDDPDLAHCDDGEADYLRGCIAEIFPAISVTPDQIRHRFSGVRPLPRADGDIGLVTRDHSVAEIALDGGTPVLCLIGGKWTTFRGFSEQVARKVAARLGRTRHVETTDMAIGGGKDFPKPVQRDNWVAGRARTTGLPGPRIEVLLSRYGSVADAMARILSKGDTPLATLPDYSREELLALVTRERVGTLADLVLRRTPIAISGHLTPEVAEEVGTLVAAALNWDATRRQTEIAVLPISR